MYRRVIRGNLGALTYTKAAIAKSGTLNQVYSKYIFYMY